MILQLKKKDKKGHRAGKWWYLNKNQGVLPLQQRKKAHLDHGKPRSYPYLIPREQFSPIAANGRAAGTPEFL